MSWSSSLPWPFKKGGASGSSTKERASPSNASTIDDEELGITEPLLDFVKTFTIDAFRSYPLDQGDDMTAESDGSGGGNVRMDLTQWQEQHAVRILSKSKEVSKLRYDLVPRHMKDKQFWTVYFLLVKSYVAPYEIRAIQKAKLKMMETGGEKSEKKTVIEVEMMESNNGTSSTGDLDDEIDHT